MSLYRMGQESVSVERRTIQVRGPSPAVGLLIMVWYATTGEDREAGEADETADAASSSPGELSRVLLAIVTRDSLSFLLVFFLTLALALLILSELSRVRANRRG